MGSGHERLPPSLNLKPLHNPTPRSARKPISCSAVLRLLRLDTVFEIYNNVRETREALVALS